ncbi:MAG: AarF/ABC1/UbiB kinase family protein, partial [Propionicimonas sp.]|nr:AarF/ABC1/UbiB kinase family protein [Propionicimonas sp.]
MTDPEPRVLPEGALGRTVRMLRLPLGAATRATVGTGRKLLGADAAQVDRDMSRAAADQLFAVLGELKGGAMKFGQILSTMEAMLPEEVAAPFRDRLQALQDSAPPMPTSRVHAVLRAELGPGWRSSFSEFEARPAAAASIGQVHRARWATSGRPVAVKVQYPGADAALRSDLRQLERLAAAASPLTGGIDVRSMVREMTSRIGQEVDYVQEGAAQNQMAEALAGHPRFTVPRVHLATARVLVSDWVDGTKLAAMAARPPAERNRAALDYVSFLFAGPGLAGILHADPHPGNFLVTPDGRLAAIDFGLTADFPGGLPTPMGELIRRAVDGDAEAMLAGLVEEGFAQPGTLNAQALLDYLNPFV